MGFDFGGPFLRSEHADSLTCALPTILATNKVQEEGNLHLELRKFLLRLLAIAPLDAAPTDHSKPWFNPSLSSSSTVTPCLRREGHSIRVHSQ